MYRGRIVERMDKQRIDPELPHHPYTVRLFEAARADIPTEEESRAMAAAAEKPIDITRGCPYRGLCQIWNDRGRPDDDCARVRPELVNIHPLQRVACHVRAEQASVNSRSASPQEIAP
jgi:oligopeptide/dipeptide ABC transporter ATP-binding protein